MKKNYLAPELEQLQFTANRNMAAQDNDVSGHYEIPGFVADE